MLARIQKITTVGLLLASIAWAWACIALGKPALAGIGAALIVFSYAVFLAIEVGVVYFTPNGGAAPAPTTGQLVRAWAAEVLCAPRVFCWRQPFRSRQCPDSLPASSATPSMRPVVFVHGFLCNRGFWLPILERLRRLGIPYAAVDLEPVFGSIEDYVPAIDAAVSKALDASGLPPLVVAHSMGGLAVRAWLRLPGRAERMHRAVTIGSPHAGTLLGRYSTLPNLREMQRGSAWLTALARQETPALYARFVCFYSHCDNVVIPCSTAALPGADNRHVPGAAHVGLAFRRQVYTEIVRGARVTRANRISGK